MAFSPFIYSSKAMRLLIKIPTTTLTISTHTLIRFRLEPKPRLRLVIIRSPTLNSLPTLAFFIYLTDILILRLGRPDEDWLPEVIAWAGLSVVEGEMVAPYSPKE